MKNCLLAAAGTALLSSGALAGIMTLPDGFDVNLQTGSGQSWNLPDEDIVEMQTNPDGSMTISGVSNPFAGEATLDWSFNLLGVADSTARGVPTVVAGVASNIAVTNNTGSTQTYFFSVTQGFTVAGPLLADGSVSGTVNDGNFNGSATISDAGVPGYEALLDGVVFETLVDDPFSLTTATTAAFGPDDFTNVPTGGITTSIGIRNTFSLSAGDLATATSRLTFVPTPGAAAMLGVAGLAATRRRR